MSNLKKNDLNTNLIENINLLTKFNVNYFNKLNEENEKLKEKNKDLNESIKNLRKRKFELQDKNRELRETIDSFNFFEECYSNNKKQKKEDEIKVSRIRKYRKNKDSLEEREIKSLLMNIKNLESILNLENKWINIRHNESLQRLFNLITLQIPK